MMLELAKTIVRMPVKSGHNALQVKSLHVICKRTSKENLLKCAFDVITKKDVAAKNVHQLLHASDWVIHPANT
jgi:hypothetical protein